MGRAALCPAAPPSVPAGWAADVWRSTASSTMASVRQASPSVTSRLRRFWRRRAAARAPRTVRGPGTAGYP
ncbi:MAG: hypothetical protein ACLVJ8_07655 [Ruthenibacterium lactatiformans]